LRLDPALLWETQLGFSFSLIAAGSNARLTDVLKSVGFGHFMDFVQELKKHGF